MNLFASIFTIGLTVYYCIILAIHHHRKSHNIALAKGSPIIMTFLLLASPMSYHIKKYISTHLLCQLHQYAVEAGVEESLGAETICSLGLIMLIFGVVFGALLFNSIIYVLVCAILFALYPAFWLISKRAARKISISCALPNLLDALMLSVEAGMDFSNAILKVGKRLRAGAMRDEFGRLILGLKTGVPRRVALDKFGQRIAIAELSACVSLLIQADNVGANIGPILGMSAKRIRQKRLKLAEKRGISAAQKALFPLVLCIMPTTFIVIFGPLFVRFLTGGFNSLFN